MKTGKIYLVSGLIGLSSAALVLALFGFVKEEKPTKVENDAYREVINEKYRIFALPVPEKLDFAGENVPLEDWDVVEKMDREMLVNAYWHSNTLLSIKRAKRWFPVIEPILKANGVPDDFKYLALIESGFTNVVSPAGASGFWQFLESTGKEFGLQINDEVDERYHVEKSTQAACEYLKKGYSQYQSWALSAASYNMGLAGPVKQLEKQRQDNYWDLLLNDETSRYLYRILALKEILNNADKYGFVLRPSDLYEPFNYKTVTVDSTIESLADFALENNVTYKELKLYNPWMRQSSLKNKEKKAYEIKIPVH